MFKNSTQFTLEINLEFAKTVRVKTIFFFDLIVLIFGAVIGFLYFGSDVEFAIMLWVCFGVVGVVLPFVLKSLIRKTTLKTMQGNPLLDSSIVNNFTFSDGEMLSVATKEDAEISRLTVKYDNIVKVIENNDHLYIYVGQVQALLLNASGMTEGRYEDLIAFLKSKHMGKYYIRKGIFHKKLKDQGC